MLHPNFRVGDLAERIDKDLDARRVAEVSADGSLIRLDIMGYPTDWLPAFLYRKLDPPRVLGHALVEDAARTEEEARHADDQ